MILAVATMHSCLLLLVFVSSVVPSTNAVAVALPNLDLSHDRIKYPGLGFISTRTLTANETNQEQQQEEEMTEEKIVQKQWERHRKWAKVSTKRRTELFYIRAGILILAVTGAILPQMRNFLTSDKAIKALGVIGGGCLSSVPFLKARYLKDKYVIRMIKAEQMSQDIEAQVFQYRAQVMEYNSGGFRNKFRNNKQAALNKLEERCSQTSLEKQEEEDSFRHVAYHTRRPIPPVLTTKAEYLKRRVDYQIKNRYLKHAKLYERQSKYLTLIESTLLFGAAIASNGVTLNKLIKKSSSSDLLPVVVQKLLTHSTGWVAACTAAATAVGVHLAAQNYSKTANQYQKVLDELKEVNARWPEDATSGSAAWNKGVTDCEKIFQEAIKQWIITHEQCQLEGILPAIR